MTGNYERRAKGQKGLSSRILPRYLRRIPSIDNLIPALYLKGISTNDFPHKTGRWEKLHFSDNSHRQTWEERTPGGKRRLHGKYHRLKRNASRSETERTWYRSSPGSGRWTHGILEGTQESYPQTKEQRCWVHKTANILDKLPKSMQSKAKEHIKEMYIAPTRGGSIEGLWSFCKNIQGQIFKGGPMSWER